MSQKRSKISLTAEQAIAQLYIARQRTYKSKKANEEAMPEELVGQPYWILRYSSADGNELINFTTADAEFIAALKAGQVDAVNLLRIETEELDDDGKPIIRIEFLNFVNGSTRDGLDQREYSRAIRKLHLKRLAEAPVTAEEIKEMNFA